MAQNFEHNVDPSGPDLSGSDYEPACRLVSLFSASGEHSDLQKLALAMGRKAASLGETVLILDAVDGQLLHEAGIVYGRTLSDLVEGRADLCDVLYVTSNEHFTAAAIGSQDMSEALGVLAALSLSYDWVFAVPPAGCTPAHVQLAGASDISIISYDTPSDNFMQAYWMVDAIRRRMPKFDPTILSTGDKCDAVETALMLTDTIRDHLGAPPTYSGHIDDLHLQTRLLNHMRSETARAAVA